MDTINILIVDDDQKVINALKRILNKNEYILYSTTESEKAIVIMNRYKLDIIICDYNMPVLSGIEVLKQSKNIFPYAIRILITGQCDINIPISAINEVGIYYYISKPWVNEEVLTVIEKATYEKLEHEKKVELYEILNNSRDYLFQTASMLKKATELDQPALPIKPRNNNFKQEIKTFSIFPILEDEDIVLIKSSEIYYLYASEGNVIIVTEKEKYKSTDSLNTWEKKLDETNFFRCHRGYIVNIDKIDKISPWFNGAYNLKLKKLADTIPVSRIYMKKLRDIFKI